MHTKTINVSTGEIIIIPYTVEEQFNFDAAQIIKAAAYFPALKAGLSKQIDAAVLAIYDRPMALIEEYKNREKAASEYKDAGYTGAVPVWLSSFATPAGLTATVAADLILSQALQMRDALDSLGALRMRKYEVQLASTEAEARTAHTDIMAQIAVVAADLG